MSAEIKQRRNMKIIGQSGDNYSRRYIADLSKEEWIAIMDGAQVPGDKQGDCAETDARKINETVRALRELRYMRKELGSIQSKWDKLALAIDAAIATEKK